MAKNGKWKTEKAKSIVMKEGIKALQIAGENILTEAINNAPIKSGTLRRSGTVTTGALPDGEAVFTAAEGGTDMSKAFPNPLSSSPEVYASFNTPYARRQHEELDWNHPLGGGPKYLENAFNRNKTKSQKFIQARIERALRREE